MNELFEVALTTKSLISGKIALCIEKDRWGGGGDAVADYPILVSFLGGGDRAVIKDN